MFVDLDDLAQEAATGQDLIALLNPADLVLKFFCRRICGRMIRNQNTANIPISGTMVARNGGCPEPAVEAERRRRSELVIGRLSETCCNAPGWPGRIARA